MSVLYNREDPRTVLPQLEKQMNARFDALLDTFYPIGSYYETSDVNFDPNKTWGGKWELESEGQVHISSGVNYEVGDTGGEAEVTLTIGEIPAHTHGNKSLTGYFTIRKHGTSGENEVITRSGIVSSIGSSGSNTTTNGQQGTTSTSLNQVNFDASHEHTSVGDGGAHNNMPPYVVVNRWHRVA